MIINNVNMVLSREIIHGSLEVRNGVIHHISDRPSRHPGALDGEQAWLLPGLVELHTDNLDKCFTPRPGVNWPAEAAMRNHDALIIASGITTVLDAVAVGDVRDGGHRLENLRRMTDAVLHSQQHGTNRADHHLHLRCELPHQDTFPLFEQLADIPLVALASLMDHSPGQRQFSSQEKYHQYYKGKYHLNDEQMAAFEEEQLAGSRRWSQPNREAIVHLCHDKGITLASHDDATPEHISEAHQHRVTIAEFPTTEIAAQQANGVGMNVLMGAPNVICGGSHSGNVSAHHLATLGVLHILSSDYYPASLLEAAFMIAEDERNAYDLPRAMALVSHNPAQALQFDDRGCIEEGRRADLLLVKRYAPQMKLLRVWRQGVRVF
ncbi:alpha-D-ribose 1-methylphosphonate 5-triphosphate diphosphatase [Pectobacterium polaris]|uniref:alpha-D-ribose 1-methylphosphonate 5-triphosphate diphosphatase n=1 Tax=Pectobacterium polaris TaxID=2042057 RepID=UPI000F8D004C|nr:alpha-D-ribose 1-methylphosphonate 5-triphosphate diphosphatase [Pectobacterium polaris]RUR96366.1 phosphonate metabolism protein PhnM [Pectobacterium polaris]